MKVVLVKDLVTGKISLLSGDFTSGSGVYSPPIPISDVSGLSGAIAAKTGKFYQEGITLVANTPFLVTHNLNLANKDSFIIRLASSTGENIELTVASVNVNSLNITSSVGLTGVKCTVIG